MALAGYDVAAGDTWALNELSSAVRQGTGNARANMRAFLGGLHDGDASSPVRGVVFIAGIGQGTGDLSVYQARLQDWYEDAAFWDDLSRVASDWSQEVYGDVRHYAVAGLSREERRDGLNEYLQHQASLAAVAPASAAAARSFLAGTFSPLANAAWRYDAAFGWTDVPVDLMQDYVSAQTYALRAAGSGRFGFAWSPRNATVLPPGDFAAQTDALLVRLAAAIADSAQAPEDACGGAWCERVLDGATRTFAWRTFEAWRPSRLAFGPPPPVLGPGSPSAPIAVELQTSTGIAYSAGLPVAVRLTSSSLTGELAPTPDGPWTPTLETAIASGASSVTFSYRDASSGTATITAIAPGKTAATLTATVVSPPAPPPPPAPLPPPAPPGGGGGPAPDLAVDASAAPAAPGVGDTLTYTVAVRNEGGPASRVHLAIRLPAQVAYAGSESDRGPGCAATSVAGTLACDLDFLTSDLVATLRVRATIREPGVLVFTATSSAEPADGDSSDDTIAVTTHVAAPNVPRPAVDPPPVLRRVATAAPRATRRGAYATVAVRFRVSEAARLEARLTPLRTAKPLLLLRPTSLAGTRAAKAATVARASVRRGGGYGFSARVSARKLLRGRTYVLRLTAVDAAGQRRVLAIRVRG